MGKVFVFVNQKGGVGKTTSVINLGAYMAEAGKKVLLVDFDSQGNMTSGVGISKDKPTVYELIAKLSTPEQTIRQSCMDNLHVVPASIDLSGASIELADQDDRDFYLKNALAPLIPQYDYILIDTCPSLNTLTINALAAADEVIIATNPQFWAMVGLEDFLLTVKKIKNRVNSKLDVSGILLTMCEERTNLCKVITEEVAETFNGKLRIFDSKIPNTVKVGESVYYSEPLLEYAPGCKACKAYQNLAKELIADEG